MPKNISGNKYLVTSTNTSNSNGYFSTAKVQVYCLLTPQTYIVKRIQILGCLVNNVPK